MNKNFKKSTFNLGSLIRIISFKKKNKKWEDIGQFNLHYQKNQLRK